MGSLPSGHAGVGSATNGTFLQVGGALGVAVIGSFAYEDEGRIGLCRLPLVPVCLVSCDRGKSTATSRERQIR
jgi:hypothetical protein